MPSALLCGQNLPAVRVDVNVAELRQNLFDHIHVQDTKLFGDRYRPPVLLVGDVGLRRLEAASRVILVSG